LNLADGSTLTLAKADKVRNMTPFTIVLREDGVVTDVTLASDGNYVLRDYWPGGIEVEPVGTANRFVVWNGFVIDPVENDSAKIIVGGIQAFT